MATTTQTTAAAARTPHPMFHELFVVPPADGPRSRPKSGRKTLVRTIRIRTAGTPGS